ncbi:MAG: hypothetical protein E7311_07065 [Clostridiales bacterium]|nr:hypothetical protein [Clostridiales bacterium]
MADIDLENMNWNDMNEEAILDLVKKYPEETVKIIPKELLNNKKLTNKIMDIAGKNLIKREDIFEPENKEILFSIIDSTDNLNMLFDIQRRFDYDLRPEVKEIMEKEFRERLYNRQDEAVKMMYNSPEAEEQRRKQKERLEEQEIRKQLEEDYYDGKPGATVKYFCYTPQRIAKGISPKLSDLKEVSDEMVREATREVDNKDYDYDDK